MGVHQAQSRRRLAAGRRPKIERPQKPQRGQLPVSRGCDAIPGRHQDRRGTGRRRRRRAPPDPPPSSAQDRPGLRDRRARSSWRRPARGRRARCRAAGPWPGAGRDQRAERAPPATRGTTASASGSVAALGELAAGAERSVVAAGIVVAPPEADRSPRAAQASRAASSSRQASSGRLPGALRAARAPSDRRGRGRAVEVERQPPLGGCPAARSIARARLLGRQLRSRQPVSASPSAASAAPPVPCSSSAAAANGTSTIALPSRQPLDHRVVAGLRDGHRALAHQAARSARWRSA